MKLLPWVLLVACGPGGAFNLDSRQYNADKITTAAVDAEGKEGIRVTLMADPIGNAIDDEVSVEISLFWPVGQAPALNTDAAVGNDLAVSALPRVSCFCGSKDEPVVIPDVKGKFRLTHYSPTRISGEFDLTFTGQIPSLGGGVLYSNNTLRANAYGFELER